MFKLFGGSVLFIVVISIVIGSVLWPYTVNTWLAYFGRDAVVTWWQGAILGFIPVVGQATIPLAVITWLLMLFIG